MNKPNYSKKMYLDMAKSSLNKRVKIQGTKFDRKRRYSDKDYTMMKKLVSKGMSYNEVANIIGCSTAVVKYHTNDEYRYRVLHREGAGKHTGVDHISANDRIAYKRKLIIAGAKVIID